MARARKHVFVSDVARDAVIEECAKCVPTTWLDPLLSGPEKVAEFHVGADVEKLLRAVRDRIRALASEEQTK